MVKRDSYGNDLLVLNLRLGLREWRIGSWGWIGEKCVISHQELGAFENWGNGRIHVRRVKLRSWGSGGWIPGVGRAWKVQRKSETPGWPAHGAVNPADSAAYDSSIVRRPRPRPMAVQTAQHIIEPNLIIPQKNDC
jgi:hypothetical protein